MVGVQGFSFSGQGQNMALGFITLKDWNERKGEGHGAGEWPAASSAPGAVRDAFIFAISPPPIPELGRGTGFSFRLQDRGDHGRAALLAGA
jgi:multidrug efflux pump